MAKVNLTDDQIERLEVLGIESSTEKEARAELLEKLKEFEVEDVDDDPIEDLISIMEAFAEMDNDGKKSKKKEKKAVAPKVKNPEPDDEEVEEEIEDETADETDETSEEGDDDTAEDNDDEEEEVKPKKKVGKVTAKAKETPKAKSNGKAKYAEKPKKTETADKVKYAPNNKEHVTKMKKFLADIEGLENYDIQYKTSRIAFKLRNSNSQRSIFTLKNIHFVGEGFTCDVYVAGMKIFKKEQFQEVVDKNLPDVEMQEKMTVRNYPIFHGLTGEELDEFVSSDLIKTINDKIGKLDKKMQEARESMEEAIEKDKKAKAKKEEAEEEAGDDEDEEDEEPKKKVSAKVEAAKAKAKAVAKKKATA